MNKNYKISLMLMLALALGTGGSVGADAKDDFKRARSSGSTIEVADFADSLQLMTPGKVGIISVKANAYKDAIEQIQALGFIFAPNSTANPVLWKNDDLLNIINIRSIGNEVTVAASAATDLVNTIHSIEKNVSKGSADSNIAAVKALFSIVATDTPSKENVDKAFNNFGETYSEQSKLGKLLSQLNVLQGKVKTAKDSKGGIFVDENQMTELVTAFNSLGKITQSVQNMSSSLTAKISDKDVTADPKALISKLTDALCSGPLTSIASDINAALSNVTMNSAELTELDRMQLVLAKARSLVKLERTVIGKAKTKSLLIPGMETLMNVTKISDLIDFTTATASSAADLGINKTGILLSAHASVEAAFGLETALKKVNAKGSQDEIVNGLLQVAKTDQSGLSNANTYKGIAPTASFELKVSSSALSQDEREVMTGIFGSVQLPVSKSDEERTSKTYKPGTIFAASGDKVSNDLYNSLAAIKFEVASMADDLNAVDSKIVSVIKGRVDNKNITPTLAKDCADILKQVSAKLDSAEKLLENLRGPQKDRQLTSIKKLRATIKSINENKAFSEAAGTPAESTEIQKAPAGKTPKLPDATQDQVELEEGEEGEEGDLNLEKDLLEAAGNEEVAPLDGRRRSGISSGPVNRRLGASESRHSRFNKSPTYRSYARAGATAAPVVAKKTRVE